MILRRIGNKSKLSEKIQRYFPPHKTYIELFFGAGGMFFNKPKAKYNIVNDLDSDVFNLFQVVTTRKDELEQAFYIMPIHSDLLEYWKTNKETDPIRKAMRFLFLSNFTYLGKQDCLKFGTENPKKAVYKYLTTTADLLHDVQFLNKDFRNVLTSIQVKDPKDYFIYSDSPYLETVDKYESKGFTKTDCEDLFNCLEKSECKYAISEFDHPFILDQAEKRKLNVVEIGERQNLKNRRIEVLIMNYNLVPTLFDKQHPHVQKWWRRGEHPAECQAACNVSATGGIISCTGCKMDEYSLYNLD